MSAHTANSPVSFKLPSLSYVDARWEEPNLHAPSVNYVKGRRGGLAAWLSRQVAGFIAWRRDAQAMAELSGMSEHELQDIGLSRADLHRVFEPAHNTDLRQRGFGL